VAWEPGEVRGLLDDLNARYDDHTDDLLDRASADLAQGHVIGWHQGRFEWGPRALGHRSILADPRGAATQDRINRTVKHRERFRPFAPSILAEHVHEIAPIPAGGEQPARWMLLVAPVAPGIAEQMPATTHVDGTARVQAVPADADPTYRGLLEAFHRETGCPAVLNTSFNLKGEPIVASPLDALATWHRSELDALYLGPFRVRRS
jgi:carbamoyltransferase